MPYQEGEGNEVVNPSESQESFQESIPVGETIEVAPEYAQDVVAQVKGALEAAQPSDLERQEIARIVGELEGGQHVPSREPYDEEAIIEAGLKKTQERYQANEMSSEEAVAYEGAIIAKGLKERREKGTTPGAFLGEDIVETTNRREHPEAGAPLQGSEGNSVSITAENTEEKETFVERTRAAVSGIGAKIRGMFQSRKGTQAATSPAVQVKPPSSSPSVSPRMNPAPESAVPSRGDSIRDAIDRVVLARGGQRALDRVNEERRQSDEIYTRKTSEMVAIEAQIREVNDRMKRRGAGRYQQVHDGLHGDVIKDTEGNFVRDHQHARNAVDNLQAADAADQRQIAALQVELTRARAKRDKIAQEEIAKLRRN